MASIPYTYREFTFHSDDYTFGSIDQPEFVFPQAIDDLSSVNIHTVILPTTYYVFSSDFYTSCTINGQAITWPQGNYTPTSWIATVTPLLTNTTITYSNITGLLTIVNSAGNASIVFSPNQLAYELLGFNRTTLSGTGTLVAPNVANFSGPNYVYLRSNLATMFNQNEVNFSASFGTRLTTPNTQQSNNILAMIPIDQNTGSVVIYEDQTQRYFWFSNTSFKRVNFYFTLGNRITPLALNGSSFQVKIHGFTKDKGNLTYNKQDLPPQ